MRRVMVSKTLRRRQDLRYQKPDLSIVAMRQQDSKSVLSHPLLLSAGHELIKDDLHSRSFSGQLIQH